MSLLSSGPSRRACAAVATLTGAATLILLAPTHAHADSDTFDVATSTFIWTSVDPTSGEIGDADSFDSVRGVTGWGSDAFDGFGSLAVFDTDSGNEITTFYDRSATYEPTDNGARIAGSFEVPDYDAAISLNLEIMGNDARWIWSISGADAGNLTLAPRLGLGSDGNSTYLLDGSALTSHDKSRGPDPVIGYNYTTDGITQGWEVEDHDDSPSLSVQGASSLTLTVSLQDYEYGDHQGDELAPALVTAIAAMQQRAASLNTTFGNVSPFTPAYSTVHKIVTSPGEAFNQTFSIPVPDAQRQFWCDGGRTSLTVSPLSGVTSNLLCSDTDEGTTATLTIAGTTSSAGTFSGRHLSFSENGGYVNIDYTRRVRPSAIDFTVVAPAPASATESTSQLSSTPAQTVSIQAKAAPKVTRGNKLTLKAKKGVVYTITYKKPGSKKAVTRTVAKIKGLTFKGKIKVTAKPKPGYMIKGKKNWTFKSKR